MHRIVVGVAVLASLSFGLACGGGDDGDPGDDAFPSCDPLVLTSPGPFSMTIDTVQSAPLPFQKWTGTLYMNPLPTGVGYDQDAATFDGIPSAVGPVAVGAYTAQTNGCLSDTVKFTINVVDAPANCTTDQDCTDASTPTCNARQHCVPASP